MFDQDLSNSLWVEATSTVVYIQNRSPHTILEDMTTEESFTRKKPKVGHLSLESLWLSCLYLCAKRKEDQNGAIGK